MCDAKLRVSGMSPGTLFVSFGVMMGIIPCGIGASFPSFHFGVKVLCEGICKVHIYKSIEYLMASVPVGGST